MKTNNRRDYNFSDFTEKHYRYLIKTAKKKYSFEPFTAKIKSPHVLSAARIRPIGAQLPGIHDLESYRAIRLLPERLGVRYLTGSWNVSLFDDT